MPVAAILGTFGEHHLMIALEMFAQQSGIVRQFRTIDPQQVGGMAFNQGDASFRCRGSIVFVDQGSLSLKAASVAVMAKAFGSATSSVLSARHTLCLSTGFGIITAAVLRPAILNVLVGAMQVTEFIAHCSFTEAKGT